MTLTCPLCGAEMESDVGMAIGQHVLCPFCEQKFTYRGEGAPNADDADAPVSESANEGDKPDRFCWKCGAEVPPDSAFCPGCGQDLRTADRAATEAKETNQSEGITDSSQKKWSSAGKFQRMIYLLWVSVAIGALSTLAGCFDVREHYQLGQAGNFIFGFGFLAIQAWLIRALMRRKSWARKALIVLTGLSVMLTFFGGSDMTLAAILDLASLAIVGYCVYLCFTKEFVRAFTPDSRAQGANAIVNRMDCILFAGAFFLWCVFGSICYGVRHGTEPWLVDCFAAMMEGSSSAREEMINLSVNVCAEEGLEAPVGLVSKHLDKYIKENRFRETKSSTSDFSKLNPGKIYLGWKALKVIGIGIAAIFAFLFKRKEG